MVDPDVTAYGAIFKVDRAPVARQIAMIESDWRYFLCIRRPREEVQLVGVRTDKRALRYIKHPSDRVLALHALLWGTDV